MKHPTRAIALLLASLSVLFSGSCLAQASTPAPFSLDLHLGSQGPQVTRLQTLLAAEGLFHVVPTGYFGPLTRAAVVAFQMTHHVKPITGYFGPLTRAAINGDLLSAVLATEPTPSPTWLYSISSHHSTPVSSAVASPHAPAAPVISTPADGSQFSTSTITLTGTAEAGTIISTDFSAATTTSDGAWTLVLSGLPPGTTTVKVLTSNEQGTSSAASITIGVHVIGVHVPPAAPVVLSPAPDAQILAPDLTFSGTAQPGVTISSDFSPATTSSNGTWTLPLAGLGLGTTTVHFYAFDGTATSSATAAAVGYFLQTSFSIPFYSTTTLNVPGTQTAMGTSTGLTVRCNDHFGAAIPCTATYTANAYNPAYSDVSLAFGSSPQSGLATFSGPQTFGYYVDSVNGNDANSGTSPAQAFKTIARVKNQGLYSGESIGLANGSWWREGFTLTGHGLTHMLIGAYGPGDKPLLDESDILTGTDALGHNGSATWTNTSGTTWQVSSLPIDANPAGWVNFWKNNAFIPRAASLAACEATAGTYYVSSDLSGPVTLYYNSASASNPGSDGNLYEYSNRDAGVAADDLGTTNNTVMGLRTRRGHDNNGSIDMGNNALVVNAESDDGGKHNMLVGDGSKVENVTLHNAYYAGVGSDMLVFFSAATANLGISVDRLTATMDAYDSSVGAVYGHYTGGPGFGDVAFTNLTTTNTANTISGSWDYLLNATSTNSGSVTVNTNATLANVTLINSIAGAASVIVNYASTTATISGLNATCNSPNGCVRLQSNNGGALTLTGSTLSNTYPYSGGIYIDKGVALSNLAVTHTTFLAPVPTNYISTGATSYVATSSMIADYNTYHYSAGKSAYLIAPGGGAYNFSSSGFSSWQALGFDTHSTVATP